MRKTMLEVDKFGLLDSVEKAFKDDIIGANPSSSSGHIDLWLVETALIEYYYVGKIREETETAIVNMIEDFKLDRGQALSDLDKEGLLPKVYSAAMYTLVVMCSGAVTLHDIFDLKNALDMYAETKN